MAQKHFIGKQVFEIGVKASHDVYDIQRVIGDLYRKDMLPAFEALFNRIADEDEVIRIDKIEIDLGSIDLNGNRTEAIINQILSHLENKCLAIKRDPAINRREKEGLKSSSTRKALKTHYFDLWLYWLENGTLPSYSLQPSENWVQQVLKCLGTDYTAVTRLRNLLKKNPITLHRMVLQHSQNELISITELYTGHDQKSLLLLFDEIRKATDRRMTLTWMPYRQLETELWTYILKKTILGVQKPDSLMLGRELMMSPPLRELAKHMSSRETVLRESYPVIWELLQSGIQGISIKEWPVIDKISVLSKLDSPDQQKMETPQFFTNAGVVLLHPFLQLFFEKLKLLDGSFIKNHDSRCKAVLLMQFMATGEEIASEYDLLLLKFLCGLPVNLPLDHTLELTREEKQEAENVLQSAITHWNALGSTSPDGLREGFLVRDGKLEKEQTGWKLYVEQKPIDVLLDKLPWTLSIIKLPWMKELLYVEWS